MMTETLPGYSWYAAHEYGFVMCLQHAYPDTVRTCKQKLCVQQRMTKSSSADWSAFGHKQQQVQTVLNTCHLNLKA